MQLIKSDSARKLFFIYLRLYNDALTIRITPNKNIKPILFFPNLVHSKGSNFTEITLNMSRFVKFLFGSLFAVSMVSCDSVDKDSSEKEEGEYVEGAYMLEKSNGTRIHVDT